MRMRSVPSLSIKHTLVNVRGVSLLARLSPLLLVRVSTRRRRLGGLLRRLGLRSRLSRGLGSGGGRSLASGRSGFGGHSD